MLVLVQHQTGRILCPSIANRAAGSSAAEHKEDLGKCPELICLQSAGQASWAGDCPCSLESLGAPCKGPDEVGQVLGVEARQLGCSLRGEDVQKVLAWLVPQGAEGPQDVCNVLGLALVCLRFSTCPFNGCITNARL